MLGSFWFWALIALACILLLLEVEHDAPGWATATLLGTLALLVFFGDLPLFFYLKTYPLYSSLAVLGYFVVGVLWSIPKWYFYVSRRKEEYNKLRKDFLKYQGINLKELPEPGEKFYNYGGEKYDLSDREQLQKAINYYVKEHTDRRYYSGYNKHNPMRPDLASHKSQILMWMTYWPWSMVWTVINDPVRKAFRAIYARISGVFDMITNKIYEDTGLDE